MTTTTPDTDTPETLASLVRAAGLECSALRTPVTLIILARIGVRAVRVGGAWLVRGSDVPEARRILAEISAELARSRQMLVPTAKDGETLGR